MTRQYRSSNLVLGTLAGLPILLLLLYPFKGQSQQDCVSRQVICDLSETIVLTPGAGLHTSEADNTCIGEEIASYWVQLDFSEAGLFTFDITPVDSLADLDFILYSWDGINCDSRTVVRCMGSGPQFVNGMLTTECLGPTGLREGETDVTEMAGCSNGNNNYLAPLEVSGISSYLLLINSFRSDTTTIQLQAGDTAQPDCATSTDDLADASRFPFQLHYGGSDVVLHRKYNHASSTAYISSASGQLIQELQLGTDLYHPITGLPSTGIYFITIVSGKEVFTDRFYFGGSN